VTSRGLRPGFGRLDWPCTDLARRRHLSTFVAACDKFVYTEILRPQPAGAPAAALIAGDALKPAQMAAVDAVAREDRWAALSAVGSYLN
jgi:hypothetical protein